MESRESSESRQSFSYSRRETYAPTSSESRGSSESRQESPSVAANKRYIPASEYTDQVIEAPSYPVGNYSDSIYVVYRGERIVIKKEELEAFKAKLVYPDDYETLLNILDQTQPDISCPTPEVKAELQKRDLMLAELRKRVAAQKISEKLSNDNHELDKILGFSK